MDAFPWPDPVTLAAGDEDLEVEPFPASDWPRTRPFQEDGHLATDDYWRRHPEDDA